MSIRKLETVEDVRSVLALREPAPGFFAAALSLHKALMTAVNAVLARETLRVQPGWLPGDPPVFTLCAASFVRTDEEESVIEQWWLAPVGDPDSSIPRAPIVQMVAKGTEFSVRILEE
jgi:hypothetical protein